MDDGEREKARIAGVFDRASATYDQLGIEFFGTAAAELVRRTDPRPGESVLELGSGRGASVLPAAEAVGPRGRVVATDLAPGMLAGLRALTADVPWVQVAEGDAEHPPEGPWDVVQAGLVLFFLPDLHGTLDRVRDVLAPAGRLGFTWFGESDDSWQELTRQLRELAPEPAGPDPADEDRGPFSSVATMHDVLSDHGFLDPTTSTIRVQVEFSDADQWWAWIWSAGLRVMVERLEAHGVLDRARAVAAPELERRAIAGTLSWWTDIRCTLAHR
ncbi:methyltransferase domain-containing protein [Nocardioides sp. S-58]|uniref:Methyltransferase domain-containing protein n=1 Tax=Nocardioides renjunii TaxID=3095075 RepID=A0ABU5KCA5_9ACTN|nr:MULTISPECIES: methyltransferase domain-containing protein [unclassified Nocardioides]MDZ5662601.1 methyltransferase domain-containing protein [Nocardioides sp. S-58]WQQ23606.1 methyltransferase domain-containing protein [Nocardioides sp. S-34]